MNILLISPYFSPTVGGVETHLLDLCEYLASQKHMVWVRTYQTLGTKIKGNRIENSKYIRIHRMWWPDFNLIFHLEKYQALKFFYVFTGIFVDSILFLVRHSNEIDVIQVHGFIASCVGIMVGKFFRKRVVINTHVGFKFQRQTLMTKVLKHVLSRADEILVLTSGAKKSLTNLGIPEEKIIIYHYWVDQKIFSPSRVKRRVLGQGFVVLFVGRLIDVKGVYTLLQIARDMKHITFAIAGSGPLSEKVISTTRAQKNIIFLGAVDHNNLPTYYNAADVLLIPSRIIKQEYEEGIPRVMIEALSCGLPVVATPSGGIPDIFSTDIGKIVPDNKESIMSVIQELYRNSTYLTARRTLCRSYALKVFSIKNAKIIERSLTNA